MAISKAYIDADVHHACLLQALTTEREEVVNILLGTVENDVAYIKSLVFGARKDKQRDRVEIEPLQLSSAVEVAEKKGLKVVGWCHSHPGYISEPSSVDLNTQHSLQSMDSNLFGLIVSCFDKSFENKIQLIGFQATVGASGNVLKKPLTVITKPVTRQSKPNIDTFSEIAQIPAILVKEEKTAFSKYAKRAGSNETAVSYHSLLYLTALVDIQDKICGPILHVFKQRHEENLERIRQEKDKGKSIDLISL